MPFQYSVILNDPNNAGGSADPVLVYDLQQALNVWSQYITGAGTLVVSLNIAETMVGRAEGGPTSSSYLSTNSQDLSIWEPSSLYELRTGHHVLGTTSDITITIDPVYMAILDLAPNLIYSSIVPNNEYNPIIVFLHELGHGLGISGYYSQSGALSGSSLSMFDTFISRTADGAYFTGPNAEAAYGGPVPLTTNSTAGENYYHFGDTQSDWGRTPETVQDPLTLDLMNGIVLFYNYQYPISNLDLGVLRDLVSLENDGSVSVNSDNTSGGADNDFIHRAGDGRVAPAGYNDITDATTGDDIINGLAGDDNLFGDDGDDILNGGLGADALNGGGGFDFASYVNATAGVTASLADPTVNTGEAAGDTYTSIQALIGSGFNDTLIGDAGINVLRGGGGDDLIVDDTGASSDLEGDAGNDTIYGGAGNDYIVGGDGNDVVVGGVDGQDSLYAGAGDDYLVAADLNNDGVGSVLDGGAGANQLYALVGSGNDYAVGGEGNDVIATGAGSDYIFGNDGNDTIVAGSGTDYIFSGAGNDFIYTDDTVTNSQDFVYVSGLTGFGTGVDTVADFTPGAGGDVAVILGTPGLTSFAQVQANMTDIGVYTVVTLSATDQLYLYNVDPFQLTPDNFLFL